MTTPPYVFIPNVKIQSAEANTNFQFVLDQSDNALSVANTANANANSARTFKSVLDYGVVADRVFIPNCASITVSTFKLTVTDAQFTLLDVGKIIAVQQAGAAGATLISTIASFVSATQVNLADPAQSTVNAVNVSYGTDNTTALQNVVNAISNTTFPPALFWPSAGICYKVSPNWAIPNSVHIGNPTFNYMGTNDAILMTAGDNPGINVSTANINGTVLTLTGTITGGAPTVGQLVSGLGVKVGTYIVSGSGTSWIVNISQTVRSTNMNLGLCYNLKMYGTWTIEDEGVGINAVYVNSVHHSLLNFNVRSCNTANNGLVLAFAVCTEVRYRCSPGALGFYNGLTPNIGLYLANDGSGKIPSYCTFPNLVVEHTTSKGVYATDALGCLFEGGTCEGVGTTGGGFGMYLEANTFNNKIVGMDFEANGVTGADVYDNGNNNQWISVDSLSALFFGPLSVNSRVIGGIYSQIIMSAGAKYPYVDNAVYNRNGSGVIVDNGAIYPIINAVNGTSTFVGTAHISGSTLTVDTTTSGSLAVNSIISGAGILPGTTITAGTGPYTISIPHGTLTTRAITASLGERYKTKLPNMLAFTAGTSPYTYTNNSSYNEIVFIVGGLFTTDHTLIRNAIGNTVNNTNLSIFLAPGDQLTMTYTSAPTLVVSPFVQ